MQIGTCETFLDLCVFQNFTGSQASNLADFLMGFSEELISFPGIKIKKKKLHVYISVLPFLQFGKNKANFVFN